MTLNHGFPPPGSSISSDDQAEKSSECGTSTEPPTCPNEDPSGAPVHQEIKEIKSMIGELRSAQNTARVEQVFGVSAQQFKHFIIFVFFITNCSLK